MAINYPGSLDNFTNPTSASPINSPSHADQHSNANDAIEALEAKVGANSSAVTTSHDYKIAQLESLVTSAVAGAKSIYQDVRNQSGSSFVKATPVYISGSEGSSGKMLISSASNASEATSSKTMGITTSAISNNSNGQVISEGILEGIDTTGAVDGDPVWLGVNGAKIYGLLNKPSAPAHLVFLGIVIRGGQANTGSIYVKIQNGFELQELHNVEISSLLNGNILSYDSATSTWKNTNTLQSTSSTIPLVVKASSSQTTNVFEVQNSDGAAQVYVNSFGQLSAVASGMYVNSGYSSGIGLIVRGYASQTANLQEWQDNTGAVKALVGSGGNAVFNGIRSGSGSTTAAINAYTTAAQIGILVRGAASQSANLQEWQDSAGTVLTRINSAGNVYTSGYLTAGVQSPTGTLTVVSKGVSVPVAVIKGAASQTANIQEWQDSAGTTLVKVQSDGTVGVNGTPGTNTKFYIEESYTGNSGANTALRARGTGSSAFNWKGRIIAGGDTVAFLMGEYNSQAWLGGHNAALNAWASLRVNPDGPSDLYLGNKNGGGAGNAPILTIKNDDAKVGFNQTSPTAQVDILTTSATNIGLIVKGFASQTADLQQWQDSTGAVLAEIMSNGSLLVNSTGTSIDPITVQRGSITRFKVDPYGNVFAPALTVGNTTTSIGGTSASIGVGSAATIGLIIKGAASQTANLQEWQSSSGSLLTSIKASGNLAIGTTQAGINGQANTAGVVTHNTSPLLVRGSAAGQNLIELWAYGKDAYITGAVGNGTSVTYTTSIAHGFTTSDYVIVNGIIGTVGSGTLNVGGGATVSAVTTYTFTLPNTTTQTYVSGGYSRNAQYPGNILQAYRSDGMSLFTIGSSGGFAMADVMSVANVGYQQAGISVQPNLSTSAAIRMYARSAQTAEILDVRNYIYKSGGSDSIFAIVPDYSVSANADGYSAWVRMRNAATPTVNPTSAGYLYVGSGALNYMGTSNVPQQIVGADGSVKFTSPAASITPLIIQHTASPTSSYFEIRNSAGNPVWGINSSGESRTRTTTKFGANIQNDSNNANTALTVSADQTGIGYPLLVAGYGPATSTTGLTYWKSGAFPGAIVSKINYDGSLNTPYIQGNISSTISANTATTVDTVALSSFTTIEYTLSIKQGSKIRSSKVLVHTDGTSVDSTEYGIIEMGGGITGILVAASVSSTNSILQVTITDADTTNATVKLIKTML